MAWVKIDDHFYDHPKWRDAPGDSIALWLAAIAWCNRNDSFDGEIPDAKLAGLIAIRNAKTTKKDLINRGAFEEIHRGVRVHDFAEWQQNEKVRAIREKRVEAGRKGAAARWQKPSEPMANRWQVPWQTDGKENAPPPTTHNYLKLENNSNHENSNGPMAFAMRLERIAQRHARDALATEKAKGRTIANDDSYMKPIRQRFLENPDLAPLCAKYPKAPDDVIIAALNGDTHSLPFFTEPEP